MVLAKPWIGEMMRTKTEITNGDMVFKFEPSNDDMIQPVDHYKLIGRKMKIKIPKGVNPEKIHPDHLALITILAIHPFTRGEMIFPKAVSKRFFEATQVVSRYKCSPVDEELEAWNASDDSSPGLAFSGGADSTAALAVMPATTVPIFMDRPFQKGSLYDKSAAIESCRQLELLGFNMQIIECDVEHIRDPVGFPTDVANAIPAIFLASELNINSISYGTILESSYGTGHDKFRDYPNLSHWRLWSTLFAGAGLPMALPVAGVSEVGTRLIVEKAPLGYVAQSCIRGKWREPCWDCWKCFRKGLLGIALKIEISTIPQMGKLFSIKEAIKHLIEIPIKHENVLAYAVQRLPEGDEFIDALRKRVLNNNMELKWLENWFEGSLELVPKTMRKHLAGKLNEYLGKMDKAGIEKLTSWNMEKHLNSKKCLNAQSKLIKLLQQEYLS